ncbi:MAG TPA: HD domain-containing phosphohydrolase [Thermoanaerobaculia bacterium]|nr:HD domain-containing phosphohydrolase [Thermoanaerobaculia bacterium]
MEHDDVGVSEQEFAVLNEVRPLEPELKRALYSAYELAAATKAALYLAVSYANERYELVTSYAFTPADRRSVDGKDPLVQRLGAAHGPIVVNAMSQDERIAEVLFRHGNERLLAVPIFGRGRRMVGFIDLRDKAGRKNFDASDVVEAEKIAREVVKVLASKNLYGVGRISLVDVPKRARTNSGAWSSPRLPIARKPEGERPAAATLSTRALEVIRRAHERMTHRDLAIDRRRRILTAEEFERVRMLLPAALSIPGVAAAVLTNMTHDEMQMIAAHGELTPEAAKLIQVKIGQWAKRAPRESSKATILPSRNCRTITHDSLRMVASSQLSARAVERLVLTIAFEITPDDATRRQIEQFADHLGNAVEAIIGRIDAQSERRAMAQMLLEPDFNRYEGLADHCKLVSDIAQRFAVVLGLPAHDAETVRIAALVHDVGLRLLDYNELTSAKELSEEHKRAVTEHPLVGAALVEPILGSEVALAVLRHHERVDGTGYPGRIPSDRIPVAAKILAIADAWVAMTSPWPYIACVPPGDAVARLRDGAGTQFDASLVGTFLAARLEIVGNDED